MMIPMRRPDAYLPSPRDILVPYRERMSFSGPKSRELDMFRAIMTTSMDPIKMMPEGSILPEGYGV